MTIRLLDPPLHEFLPNVDELLGELSELKMALRQAATLADMDHLLDEIDEKRQLLHHVNKIREANPMLGFRGCRLGLLFPEVTRMQCRAIFEAACQVKGERKQVMLEIMVPLVSISEELKQQAEMIHDVAREVTGEHGMKIEYLVGTMIELPRACLTADKIAEHARLLLVRHKRSDADDLRLEPRRLGPLPAVLCRSQDSFRRSFSGARPRRRGRVGAHRRRTRPQRQSLISRSESAASTAAIPARSLSATRSD